MLEIVQLNMLKIVAAVNKFDASTRAKLSELNEKIVQLERSLQMAEVSIVTAENRGDSDGDSDV